MIVIRSGALGDFILTLPLIHALAAESDLLVISRPTYRHLLDDRVDFLSIESVAFASLLAKRLSPTVALRGRQVLNFLPDADGAVADALTAAGASAVVQMTSRPTTGPHICKQMFAAAGLAPPSMELASLARDVSAVTADALWMHPGSGSPRKNAPLSTFREFAAAWMCEHGGSAILSFGEADEGLLAPAKAAFSGMPCEFVYGVTLPDLCAKLASRAAYYVGNDSGVSHLAVAMGIPAHVFFLVTDPAIWRPLGPSVTVQQLS